MLSELMMLGWPWQILSPPGIFWRTLIAWDPDWPADRNCVIGVPLSFLSLV